MAVGRFLNFLDFAWCVRWKVIERIFPWKWIHRTHFSSNYSGQFFNKDHTVWFNGSTHACIPPSFLGYRLEQLSKKFVPKNTCASIKNNKILWDQFKKYKNQRVSLTNMLLATASLSNMKLKVFTCPMNMVPIANIRVWD